MREIIVRIISHFEGLLVPLAQRGEPRTWGPEMMGNWGFGWFGPILMLVFWVLLISVLILLARWLWGSSPKKPEEMRPEPPLDILKRRYASGEIDREEFELKKRDLSQP
jgi:putative membrane protein